MAINKPNSVLPGFVSAFVFDLTSRPSTVLQTLNKNLSGGIFHLEINGMCKSNSHTSPINISHPSNILSVFCEFFPGHRNCS